MTQMTEKHLRGLLTTQRKHLEEIKKATNYDSTRKLIERYDETGSPAGSPAQLGRGQRGPQTPVRAQPGTPTPVGKQGTPRAPGHLTGVGGTPARQSSDQITPNRSHPAGQGSPIPIPEGLAPEQAAALQLQMQAIQPVLPTPEKRWYDRVVDSILGDDPCEWIVSVTCCFAE